MARQIKYFVKDLIRALRLPFICASALPFIFGSLVNRYNFNISAFTLGLMTVVSTHLSANLINDYADSRSAADWQDRRFYIFFGGSKLIQEGVFSEKFYLTLALSFVILSSFSLVILAVILKSAFILFIFPVILFFSWSYSAKPLQFSYHRFGEIAIFILFGPVPVMAGYFLQTKIFPDMKSFMLSVPFGFLTTAILYANEIPDSVDDEKVGKLTWANVIRGEYAYLIYCALMASAFLSICLNVICGYVNLLALFSLPLILLAVKAAMILKKYPGDKKVLMESSKLTVAVQAMAGLILIIGVLL